MTRMRRTLATAVLAVVISGAATWAVGDDHEPEGAEPAVSMSVIRAGTPVPTAGAVVSAVLDVTNLTPTDLTGVRARVAVTSAPVTTSEELAEFLANPGAAALREVAHRDVGVVPVPEDDESPPRPHILLSQETRQVTVSFVADEQLLGDSGGVYGVAYGLEHEGTTTWVDAGALTWVGSGIPTLALTVVATITDGANRASSLLAAAEHPRVTLLVDVASYNEIPAPRPSLVDREVYRLPWGHPDLSALAHAGDERLGALLVARADTVAPRSVRGAPWLAVLAVLDETSLEYVTELGAVAAGFEPRYTQADAHSFGSGVITVDSAQGGRELLPVITPHPTLSALVAGYRPHHPTTPGRIVAEAALVAIDTDGLAPIVIAPGASWMVDGTVVSPTLEALLSAPFVAPQSLAATLSSPTRERVTVPQTAADADSIDPASVAALTRRIERIQAIAAASDEPAVVATAALSALAPALSPWQRLDPEARTELIAATLETLTAQAGALAFANSSAVNLVSSSGNLPVTVRNDLPVDVTVTVQVTSHSAILVVGAAPTLTIAAHSEATAMVPVTAVSSGNVTLSMSLRNEDGMAVSDFHTMSMRVRAEWGNMATAIGTLALAVLLIAGVARTIKRGRAETRVGPDGLNLKGSDA